MQLKEIMSQNVRMIASTASVAEAAAEMSKADIGFLAVVNDKIIGVVTDRDIVVRAIAEGRDPRQTSVDEIMTVDIFVLSPDDSVESAALAMQSRRVRRLLLQDDSGKCVGIVSLGDLAAAGQGRALTGQTLEEVCSH